MRHTPEYDEGKLEGANEEAAKHADCCIDREEFAAMLEFIRECVQGRYSIVTANALLARLEG